MEINQKNLNRERELYQRQLAESTKQHGKELEHVKGRYKENVNELDKAYSSNTEATREENKQTLEKVSRDNQSKVQSLEDKFDRQSREELKGQYDRYGRAQEEHQKELRASKYKSDEQVKSMEKTYDKTLKNIKDSREEDLGAARRSYEQSRFRSDREADQKIQRLADAYEKQTTNNDKELQGRLKTEMDRNFDELRKQKMGSNLRLENLQNQKMNEVEDIKHAFKMRENQLVQEKDLLSGKVQNESGLSLEKYRTRLANDLARNQEDNNFYQARREIAHANEVSQNQHESRLKEQSIKQGLERHLAEAKTSGEAEKERMKNAYELANRRLISDGYLTNENTKQQYEDAMNVLKEKYSENLSEMNQKSLEKYDNSRGSFNKRIESMEQGNRQAKSENEEKNLRNNRENSNRLLMERSRLTSAYEASQKAISDKARQTVESKEEDLKKEKDWAYKENQKKISSANMENAEKLYKQRVRYENINELQDREYMAKVNDLEKNFALKTKNLSVNQNLTLADIETIHKEQVDALVREGNMALSRQRVEADSMLKNQSFDYEFKIKDMAQSYEGRLAEMEMKYEREIKSMKQDHEKMIRTQASRHKNDVESLMDSQKKTLDLQEKQFKERTKVAANSHETEKARLRHSNELLRQKS